MMWLRNLEAISQSRGHPAVRIAVLDGAVRFKKSVFKGENVIFTGDASQDRLISGPITDHGTQICSIIFGERTESTFGISPDCTAIIVPVLFDRPDRRTSHCSQNDLARAIYIAIEAGAHVINISAGQLSNYPDPDPELGRALDECARAGVLVVAAAGNDGCDCLHYPAAVSSVLAIGACDQTGSPLEMSNWGSHYADHGVLVLGENIPCIGDDDIVVERSGTSFATAIATGVIGLALSVLAANGEPIDPIRIKNLIIATASPCDPNVAARSTGRCLSGRLNISHVFNMVRSKQMYTENTQLEHVQPKPHIDLSGAGTITVETLAELDAGVTPSCGTNAGCGCSAKVAPQQTQLVYAIGTLGVDFGTEARRDSIAQYLPRGEITLPALVTYLRSSIEETERLIWTLQKPSGPAYAIRPSTAFAMGGYAKLLDGLEKQINAPSSDPVSVALPGFIIGNIGLLSGQTLSVVCPAVKGLQPLSISQTVAELTRRYDEAIEQSRGNERRQREQEKSEFLSTDPGNRAGDLRNRITFKYDNLGLLGRDRALNYVWTIVAKVIAVTSRYAGYELDEIAAARSSVERPGTECYDVDVRLFSPTDVRLPIIVARFTVDVSDMVPVYIQTGAPAVWTERPKN